MSRVSSLAVWSNGTRVATWAQVRGTDVLQYEPEWLDSPAGRPLSLSLPFTPGNVPHRGLVVSNFFDNLLPDSDAIRRRIRSKFQTGSTAAFELLGAIGRDCVGAVQLMPPGHDPTGFDRMQAEALTDRDVERVIEASLSDRPMPGQLESDDFRISIAGAQEKTALLFYRRKWCRPLGATPTTHIFKLPLGLVGHLQMDLRESVENEWLCLRLMRAFGLETASAEMRTFGKQKVLVVERFDRAYQDNRWIARLPQEDFCQALGKPGSRRYESDGGPGMRDILRVLDTSSRPEADKRAFVKAQIIFWMLAAIDGHAKNYSIFHERGGGYRLTPFYDVLSAWPIIGRDANHLQRKKARMAMAVRSKNAHWRLDEIQPQHWNAVTRFAGLGDAVSMIEELVRETPRAIEEVNREVPPKFPPVVCDKIFEGLRSSAKRLA
jgi:serine/threonine-protein kinase HipA